MVCSRWPDLPAYERRRRTTTIAMASQTSATKITNARIMLIRSLSEEGARRPTGRSPTQRAPTQQLRHDRPKRSHRPRRAFRSASGIDVAAAMCCDRMRDIGNEGAAVEVSPGGGEASVSIPQMWWT